MKPQSKPRDSKGEKWTMSNVEKDVEYLEIWYTLNDVTGQWSEGIQRGRENK